MLVLGIESSCDETACAVVTETGRVLSDVVQSQVATHAPFGGIVPELASRDHLKNARFVVRDALSRAGVSLGDVDGVAVTNRPGLVGALLVGVQFAKGLAWATGKPIVGVDHLVGHLVASFLQRDTPHPVPSLPFVALLVSGGHTAIYRVDGLDPSLIRELGATHNDAAGEAFDKVAKLFGLGYPGGPAIDRLARGGRPDRYEWTVPMRGTSSLEMSFSGLKTQIMQHVAKNGVPEGDDLADACVSFQAQVTFVLTRKLVAAATREGVRDVVIGGGVAANRELRERVVAACKDRGLVAHVPEIASCTDNAAMIAYAGAVLLGRGVRDDWALAASSKTLLPRATRKGGGAR